MAFMSVSTSVPKVASSGWPLAVELAFENDVFPFRFHVESFPGKVWGSGLIYRLCWSSTGPLCRVDSEYDNVRERLSVAESTIRT